MTNENIDKLRDLATKVTTETLHGHIPVRTTMELATGILGFTDPKVIEHRGLVIMSALVNFIDWLYDETDVIRSTESDGGQLVRQFLESHSDKRNYFVCADEITERLGEPFNEILDSGKTS
jgi:hypothetical protein